MDQRESDAELIEASLENPELFAVVFDRHFRDIHRFATASVGHTDGPDLACEVFLRAFATRHRYRSAYASARPWLWGIAANLIRDHFRSRARQARAYRRAPPPPDFEPDPSEEATNRITAEAERPNLAMAIQALRSEDADVLLLFAVAGLSYAEIAEVLGIAEGTVRSRLNRTRTKLRNLLPVKGESLSNDE